MAAQGAEGPVILLINDEYGTSKGGISTVNCQVGHTLKGKAVVYATVLQLSVPKQDQEAADRDKVKLITPVQPEGDTREPPIHRLAFDYKSRYPKSTLPQHEYQESRDPKSSLPPHVDVIIGHADITDRAARNIQNDYYKDKADLIMFTHVLPEDTEYFKEGQKVIKASEKEKIMVNQVQQARAVFSVGERIFKHFHMKYKPVNKQNDHHLFFPRPSKIFEEATIKSDSGEGELVVLSIGRVKNAENLKGYNLAARAIRIVRKYLESLRWIACGISEDDWAKSMEILQANLNSGDLNPTLHPYGTQEEILYDMKTAHLVLMPSRSEPFGLVGLEAIAAGIPVLISDKSGLADMIKKFVAEKKLPRGLLNRIVRTSVQDSDMHMDNTAEKWADKIEETLNDTETAFDQAKKFKDELLKSKYWEDSESKFLQACGITELKGPQDHEASGNTPEKKVGKVEVAGTSTDFRGYFRYIKENVTAEWRDLADVLGLTWEDITNIEGRNKDDKTRCWDALQEWKKRKGGAATMSVLMDALRELELMSVVDGLKAKFSSNAELQDQDASGNPPEKKDGKDEVAAGTSSHEDSAEGGNHSKGPRVILLINDEYGTSKGGISTINCQAGQTLKGKADVYATVLQLSVPKQDQEAADRDGVKLIGPVQLDKESEPTLDWLTDYHSVHFPNLPKDVTCIIGHADITDTAARDIKDRRYPHADLMMFTHVIPEDTERYKGGRKAMKAWKKEKDMLDKVDKAKAAFSVGRRIFHHFSNMYRGGKEPQRHLLFLPKPSELLLAAKVRPGGRQKVVLSIGRVRKVEKLKGHDLAGQALRDVVKIIKNVQWCVRGISEDDFEMSKKILEDALNSPDLLPTLLPYGTQEEIMEDMLMAHLVLMPSRSEPFGLVGLEAIAAGIPVLISDKTGLADMILDLIKEKKLNREHRHVIVETSVNDRDRAGDAERWAKKIVDVLQHSDSEFEKAARFKQELVESRYWEESHNAFLQACGITA